MTEPTVTLQEKGEARKIAQAAFELARNLGISQLLVQADELVDVEIIRNIRESERIIWLARADSAIELPRQTRDIIVKIPSSRLSRISQINMGFFLAVLKKSVDLDESVVCLTGISGSEKIDTIVVANPRSDFPWLPDSNEDVHFTAPREVARVIEIALRFSAEGREGRPVGTLFVVGDEEELAQHVKQLVLNPCKGHAKRKRSIHDPKFFETLRELAAMDGAFIISNKGIVESAGSYIDAPTFSQKLPPGLGARHSAAAAITASTLATAIVVSESSGTVTVFHNGYTILELEKTQLAGVSTVRDTHG